VSKKLACKEMTRCIESVDIAIPAMHSTRMMAAVVTSTQEHCRYFYLINGFIKGIVQHTYTHASRQIPTPSASSAKSNWRII